MVGTRSRSRSRSSSRSPKERVDKFGRVIPPDRSGSRSRSRSQSRRGSKRRSKSRSPLRSYHRSRSRSRSHSSAKYSRREDTRRIQNRTNIEDPEFLNARLFIGNLPSSRVSKEELESLFNIYGKILGVSIHDRGFGFVQFEKEDDARRAKEAENGTKLKGSVLDVKMAAEGRRGGGGRGRGGGRDYDREPHMPGRGGPLRERSPARGDPYEDRYRDPYRREPPAREDPYYRDDPYRRPPPPPHDDPYRDPYREDPYRREAPPPYRRDPYDDPYRDPYRDPFYPPPPKKPMPADVQIICMNKQLMGYADAIEARLRQHALITEIVVIAEDLTVPQMVEEAARLKFLFAITVNSQNEVHKSLTLNILHGTPQEHRNMPMEDATKLVATSFEKYIQAQREKATLAAAAPAPGAPAPAPVAPAVPAAPRAAAGGATPPFLPPSTDISYLLNLLADNRQLTVEEIDKVVEYLQERKNKMLVAEGRQPESTAARPSAGAVGAAVGGGDTMSTLHQQQQEIQSKILNILNGSSSSTGTTLTAASQQAQGYSSGVANQVPRLGAQVGGTQNQLLNLDNPNVKKALDNLIQSGPSLLKSIPSSLGQQQAPPRNQFAGQSQPVTQRYSSQQSATAAQPQASAQMGGYAQYYPQQQQQAQGVLRSQTGAYGAQQASRPLMSTRTPQQGVRPRY